MANFRPELYRPDFSGYARAGEAWGNAFSNIGKSLGSAFQTIGEQRREQKKIEDQQRLQAELQQQAASAMAKYTQDDGTVDISGAAADASLPVEVQKFILSNGIDINKSLLDSKKTKSELDSKHRETRIEDFTNFYSQQDFSPMEFIDSNPAEIRAGYANAQDRKLRRKSTEADIESKTRPPKPTQREQQIAARMRFLGEDEATATQAIDGGSKTQIFQDPTGALLVFNRETNELTDVINPPSTTNRMTPESVIKPEEIGSPNLYDRIDRTMTGALPAIKGTLQRFAGQLGDLTGTDLGTIDPAVQETWQEYDAAQRELVRALQQSPKFADSERKAIAKEVDITPGAFVDTQTLKARLKAIDKSLRGRLQYQAFIANNQDLPLEDRAEARRQMLAIGAFLSRLNYQEPVENPIPDEYQKYIQ